MVREERSSGAQILRLLTNHFPCRAEGDFAPLERALLFRLPGSAPL